LTQALGGTNFVGGTDVVVFKYAVDLAAPAATRTVVGSVPLANVNISRTTWYTAPNGLGSYNATQAESDIAGATVNLIVPAPGAIALLGLGGLAAARRRR
jgi:hypothetical protein